MRELSIMFTPDYLRQEVLDDTNVEISSDGCYLGIKLSKYDNDDNYLLNRALLSKLTSKRLPEHINTKGLSRLINYYYQPGVFVFNEDTITMNGENVFEIVYSSIEDHCLDGLDRVTIICSKGSVNILVDRDAAITNKIGKWLIDYMVKRLGEDVVINSQFFSDYWLQK